MLVKFRDGEYRWKNNDSDKDYMGSFLLKESPQNEYIDCPVVELWSLGIYGPYRGNGYSYKMLKEAIALAKSKPVILYVHKNNAKAIYIYKKAGFEIVGEHNGYAWAMLRKE